METKTGLLFDANPTPMLFFSGEERTVTKINRAFASRYAKASEIVGTPLEDLTEPIPIDFSTKEDREGKREYLSLLLPAGNQLPIELIYNKYCSEEESLYLGSIREVFPPFHQETPADHPVFRTVFDKALDIILIADKEGQLIDVNDTACKKLGYERAELSEMSITDITDSPINLHGSNEDDYSQAMTDGERCLLKTKKGSILQTQYRIVDHIRPGVQLLVFRDVTPQKNVRAREWLKNEDIEYSMNGIAFLDADFKLTDINQAGIEMWGYDDREDLVNRPVSILFEKPTEIAEIKKKIQNTGQWHGQLTARGKNNYEFEVNLSIISMPDESDSSLRWIVCTSDISNFLETHRALQKSKSRFRRLLESAPDAILIADKAGTINFCNSQTEQMMGYSKEELAGEPVEKLIPESARMEHIQHRMEYAKNPHKRPMGTGLELRAVRKDGSTFPVDIMLGPMEEEENLNILAIIRDITRFKETQQKLEDEQEFTRLLHHLTVTANQAENVEEALQQSIEKICDFMDWPVGHVYLPADDGTGEFYPTDIWYLEQSKKFDAFRKLTMVTRFSPGMGMVGEVIETGNPQWYMNAHEDPGFVRRLPDMDLGIRACFGLPILVEENVVGVLEFFSSTAVPSDTLLLEKMTTIGNQLGRVAERHQAEQELKHSEAKFKILFETALDGIFILDKNQLLDCNPSALELFKTPKDELINRSVESFFPKEQPDGSNSAKTGHKRIKEAFNGMDQSFEWKFKRPDGTEFEAEVSLIHMELEGQPLVQAIIRDITERKKSERLIQENMELFSQLFHNSPVGIIMMDDSKKVIDVNRSFEQMFGYKSSEIEGKNVDNYIVPEGAKKEAQTINKRTFRGDSFQTEAVRTDKKGNEIPVLIGTVPVTLEDQTIATFGIYVDISDRKRAEKKLRQSLDEKEVMLKEIHHRVKNNLAVISGLLELQVEKTTDDKAYEKLKDSQSRIHSMALVHEQLYQMEFFSSLRLDEYIKELSNTILMTFVGEKVDIKFEFDLEPVELSLNQAVPCGLLLNELLTNAFKHAFTGRQEGIVDVSLHQSGNDVRLEVNDNGVGIPQEMIEGKSNSLGMTLIQTLSSQLEGDLDITVENGTSFKLEFSKEVLESI